MAFRRPCLASSPVKKLRFYEAANTEQRELAADDVAGACFLYPASGCATAGCPTGMACGAEGCVSACGSRACAADEVCEDGACVRAAAPAECDDEHACPVGEGCSRGRCVSLGAGFGDPCGLAEECAGRVCTADGYCSVSCEGEGGCPAGTACEAGECTAELGVFGEGCEFATDCVTNICLEDASGAAACSRRCWADEDCPGGHVCGVVSGESVCRAPVQGGCSTTSVRGNGVGAAVWLLGLGLLFWRRR